MRSLVSYMKYGLLALGLAGIAFYLYIGPPPKSPPLPQELVGMMAGAPKEITSFQLVDQENKPFTLASLQGHWSMLFFGYAHCPDICPVAMEDLKEIFAILEKTSPNTFQAGRGIFVSVDPQRDTPEMLAGYVRFFHKKFMGITGSEEALSAFSRQMGAGYRIIPGKSADDYLVAHTSNFYLIDPLGQFVAYFSPPHDPAAIAAKWTAIRLAYGDSP